MQGQARSATHSLTNWQAGSEASPKRYRSQQLEVCVQSIKNPPDPTGKSAGNQRACAALVQRPKASH
eukprot:1150702-Rhodomonas_salina.2